MATVDDIDFAQRLKETLEEAFGGPLRDLPKDYNWPYVTVTINVELHNSVTTAAILQALWLARLLKCDDEEPESLRKGPRLEIVGVGDHTVTLRDASAPCSPEPTRPSK